VPVELTADKASEVLEECVPVMVPPFDRGLGGSRDVDESYGGEEPFDRDEGTSTDYQFLDRIQRDVCCRARGEVISVGEFDESRVRNLVGEVAPVLDTHEPIIRRVQHKRRSLDAWEQVADVVGEPHTAQRGESRRTRRHAFVVCPEFAHCAVCRETWSEKFE